MDFLQLWSLVRRGWRLLALSIVLGVAVAAGVSWLQPTLYSATSTGYVVAGSSATVGDAFAGKSLAADKAATYLPLVQSRSVAERIAEDMGLASASEVAGRLKASNTGVIFHITATASSPPGPDASPLTPWPSRTGEARRPGFSPPTHRLTEGGTTPCPTQDAPSTTTSRPR